MRKNHKSKKSLDLNTETLRSLQDASLDGVAGGTNLTEIGCGTVGKGSCRIGTSCQCQW